MSLPLDDRPLARPTGFDPTPFFTHRGRPTLVGPDDLDAAVPETDHPYLDEVDRYWLDPPNAFAVVYHSRRENQFRYFAVEPRLTPTEATLLAFLEDQLRMEIDYDAVAMDASDAHRIALITATTTELLRRYHLVPRPEFDPEAASRTDRLVHRLATQLEAQAARRRSSTDDTPLVAPQPSTRLSQQQVDVLTYYLVRNFVGSERLDPLTHDINVEDISCDGPGTELFIYHSTYEQLPTNIAFDRAALDTFVKRLANASGKGISRRQPDVDTTLPDGSRAQLTLAEEITTKGSNFTIRQFLDIPYTPVDLVNWRTFTLDQMAYLWLAIQYNRSVIFGGGTASGKTTTQNAVSLFIPATAKIVSIEDTPELELPQKNWIASITRQSFSKHGMDAIDEYHLLENALRQRPDYIIMGEVRGEEGRTLFQAMASGHTTFTTFHANDATQVVQRFTTDPINVKKPYFDTLDLIAMQRETRVAGRKVRRSTAMTEVGRYREATDALELEAAFEWDPATDTVDRRTDSHLLDTLARENGWTDADLRTELDKRAIVLAALIDAGIVDYGGVAGVIQGFMMDEAAILHLIGGGRLPEYVSNLRSISSLAIDVDPDREARIPRPAAPASVRATVRTVLDDAAPLLEDYRTVDIGESFSVIETPASPTADLATDGRGAEP